MKVYSVYMVLNDVTGQCYIGCTCNFERRVQDHSKKRYNQYKLYRGMDCFGLENFTFKVIKAFTDKNDAFEYEKKMIIFHNSIERGYNCARGGIGGDTFTGMTKQKKKETLEKKKKAMTGKHRGKDNPMYGAIVSKETREKKRNSMIGKNKGDRNGMYIEISPEDRSSIINERESSKIGRVGISKKTGISESLVRRVLREEGYTR